MAAKVQAAGTAVCAQWEWQNVGWQRQQLLYSMLPTSVSALTSLYKNTNSNTVDSYANNTLFFQTFFIFKKRWQSLERQAD